MGTDGVFPPRPPGAERFIVSDKVRILATDLYYNEVCDVEEGASGFLGRIPWAYFVHVIRQAKADGMTKMERRQAWRDSREYRT